jgi:hypothetical protein
MTTARAVGLAAPRALLAACSTSTGGVAALASGLRGPLGVTAARLRLPTELSAHGYRRVSTARPVGVEVVATTGAVRAAASKRRVISSHHLRLVRHG